MRENGTCPTHPLIWRYGASLPFGATLRVIPGRGWRGGKPPSTPIREAGKRSIMGVGREIWVKIRAREQQPAHDHDRDQAPEPEKTPEEVKVLRGNP